ncbi:MAG TPA: hypothetical protein VIY48_16045, partial [Candidatus Paceibacterota bacterium]
DLAEYAKALMRTTGNSDEAQMSAAGLLMELGNLSANGVKKVLPLINDFAAAMGLDLEQAATLVAKTLGSSTNALGRYGIEIKGTLSPQEKLNEILVQLNDKFGGLAKQMQETTTGGQIKAMKNQIDELKESFGGLAAKVAGPVIQSMNWFFKGLSTGDWKTPVEEARQAILDNLESAKQYQRALVETQAMFKNAKVGDIITYKDFVSGDTATGPLKSETDRATALKMVAEELETVRRKVNLLGEESRKAAPPVSDFVKSIVDASGAFEITAEEAAKLKDAIYSEPIMAIFAEDERQARLEAEKLKEELAALRKLATPAIMGAAKSVALLGKNIEIAKNAMIGAVQAIASDVAQEKSQALADIMQQVANAAVSFANSLVEGDIAGAFGNLITQVSGLLTSYALAAAASAAIAMNWPMAILWLGIAGVGIAGAIGGAALARSGSDKPNGYADGGIAWTPQLAMVGERGPEMITPLGRGGGAGGTIVNIYGNVWGEKDLARAMARQFGRW